MVCGSARAALRQGKRSRAWISNIFFIIIIDYMHRMYRHARILLTLQIVVSYESYPDMKSFIPLSDMYA